MSLEFPVPPELVTEENYAEVIRLLGESNLLAVDTETTGLNVRNNVDYLMGICISNGTSGYYFPFRHRDQNLAWNRLEGVVHLIQKRSLVWHNRKFDMHSLKTIGVDPLKFEGVQYDTLLIAHLINEEHYSFDLNNLAKIYLQKEKYRTDEIHEIGKIYGWDSIPATVMAPYGAYDATLTLELFTKLWPLLCDQGLDKVYLETEAPFTTVLYKMEQRGVGVNKEFAQEKARIGNLRMGTIKRELGYNPASTKDLAKVLIDDLGLPVFLHTPSCSECKAKRPVASHKGKPSFAKAAMREYDEILSALDNPTAKRISEYRGWQKAVTSLYEPLLERSGPDGFIRTNFKQHGTVTGRLSAEEPNLQQVPRNSDFSWNGDAKSAFTPGREGYTLIGWDYSQLELRLAAAYGSESVLLDEFKKPEADPFSVLAPLIFGEATSDEQKKRHRQDTKTFVYANLYGAGVAKIALQLGRGVDEVHGLYLRYKKTISGIMAVSNQVTRLVEQRKYVKYWDGRRRHIRNRSDAYKAWNSVCQGGGAQLVKRAMLRIAEWENEECFMVLQVHDEITFCIKTDRIEYYRPMIEKAMTDFPELNVTLAVDSKEWK